MSLPQIIQEKRYGTNRNCNSRGKENECFDC